jgi:tetratricopeptide (TPR) repeat protein
MVQMKKPRNLIIVAGIIAIVVIGGSIATILWSNYQVLHSNTNGSSTNSSSNQSSVSSPQAIAQKTANDAEQLVYDGNLQGGVQKLNDAIKNTTDTSQQFVYYSQLATLLLNNNQLPDALTAAKKAYEFQQSSDSAALVGQIAEQIGDKQTAIQYYTYALDHIDSKDMYAQSDKTYYQGIIANLQGGK